MGSNHARYTDTYRYRRWAVVDCVAEQLSRTDDATDMSFDLGENLHEVKSFFHMIRSFFLVFFPQIGDDHSETVKKAGLFGSKRRLPFILDHRD